MTAGKIRADLLTDCRTNLHGALKLVQKVCLMVAAQTTPRKDSMHEIARDILRHSEIHSSVSRLFTASSRYPINASGEALWAGARPI